MAEIFFSEQQNGYDKTQVDNYIKKLTEAYQTAYKEYIAVYEKYNALLQDYKKLESSKQTGLDAELITKALLNAEKLAKEIIDNAHTEERRIIDMTAKNLEYAYKTLKQSMEEVQKYLLFNNIDITAETISETEAVETEPEQNTASVTGAELRELDFKDLGDILGELENVG